MTNVTGATQRVFRKYHLFRSELTKGTREVNSRLFWIGICPPINLLCPPSKFNLPIAPPPKKTCPPVNYLAYRKMGTKIIETRQF